MEKEEFGKRVSNGILNKIKNDPKFAKEWSEKGKRGAASVNNKYVFSREDRDRANSKRNNKIRLPYLKIEDEILHELKTDNNSIFTNKIIDGFEIRGEKLILIEIKINSGKLTKRQKDFMYKIKNIKTVEYELIKKKIPLPSIL